jgi:hypothetical protein
MQQGQLVLVLLEQQVQLVQQVQEFLQQELALVLV